jgi:hypothetical protein
MATKEAFNGATFTSYKVLAFDVDNLPDIGDNVCVEGSKNHPDPYGPYTITAAVKIADGNPAKRYYLVTSGREKPLTKAELAAVNAQLMKRLAALEAAAK